MKYIILDLIKEKPRYGYEIMQALEELSQGMYAPSAGAVYPTLQMLEEIGYVSGSQAEGKRVYSITQEGRQFLIDNGEHTEELKGRIKDHWDSVHVGERRKVMNQVRELWQLIGQEFPDITSEKKQNISKILERTRREIQVAIGKSQK
jgi:DNA-binding PadR family transcriptional regulator